MNEAKPSLFGEPLRSEIKEILREVIREELTAKKMQRAEEEKLLAAEDAATILGQNVRWLYRHAAKLPFTRRINRKNVRFSEAGLHRWLAAKKPSSTR
jgi:predicted DNA-binding transcriptional regulator AlpA